MNNHQLQNGSLNRPHKFYSTYQQQYEQQQSKIYPVHIRRLNQSQYTPNPTTIHQLLPNNRQIIQYHSQNQSTNSLASQQQEYYDNQNLQFASKKQYESRINQQMQDQTLQEQNLQRGHRDSQLWQSQYNKYYEQCQSQQKSEHQTIDNQNLSKQIIQSKREDEIIGLQRDLREEQVKTQDLQKIIDKSNQNHNLVLNEKENQISDLSVALCSAKSQLKEAQEKLQLYGNIIGNSDDLLNKLFLISTENDRLHSIIIRYEAKNQIISQNKSPNNKSKHIQQSYPQQRFQDPYFYN